MKRRYCVACDANTGYECEENLPPQYKSGDPDYEDRTKCGACGETYECTFCGLPWNVDKEECSGILEHGYHGPESLDYH